MKRFLTILLVLITMCTFAQTTDEHWTKWNKNYPETDILQLLKAEKSYADSVERNPEIVQYYVRNATFRFNAKYLGKKRPIDPNVATSIKNVCALVKRDTAIINSLLGYEVLIRVGDTEIWMPIQTSIVSYFEEEVKPGDTVKLYCSFFNEHNSKKILYNSFLISEFIDKP